MWKLQYRCCLFFLLQCENFKKGSAISSTIIQVKTFVWYKSVISFLAYTNKTRPNMSNSENRVMEQFWEPVAKHTALNTQKNENQNELPPIKVEINLFHDLRQNTCHQGYKGGDTSSWWFHWKLLEFPLTPNERKHNGEWKASGGNIPGRKYFFNFSFITREYSAGSLKRNKDMLLYLFLN